MARLSQVITSNLRHASACYVEFGPPYNNGCRIEARTFEALDVVNAMTFYKR